MLQNGCQNSNKRCPSCNAKATVRDLRTIFASNLVALDTTEKDELIEKLHKVNSTSCERFNEAFLLL